jgi:hypothetical protein
MYYEFTETWRDIEEYEGYYQVSNQGRVKSLDRLITMKNDIKRKKKGQILKPGLDSKKRYLQVNLSKDGKSNMCRVHDLIGKAFVSGYFKGAELDHIDTITTNNTASNLRWTTRKGNMANPITKIKIKNNIDRQKIPVKGISIHNGTSVCFDSVREAKRNGFKGIGENIHGRTKHCGGYIWRYNNVL